MSAGPSGKFQDHYALLGVEPSADSETIQAAYAKLAQKFHPSNPETGNKEKFEAVNQAYEVLADPDLRVAFDKVKGVDLEIGGPKFSGAEFFDALGQTAAQRMAVLCLLYDRMRLKSFKPILSMRQLEGMLRVQGEELNFALWYLKQRGYATNDDKGNLMISVEGMTYLEQNRPSEDVVMPLIRPEAVAADNRSAVKRPAEKKPAEKPAPEKSSPEVLSVLNRALHRR